MLRDKPRWWIGKDSLGTREDEKRLPMYIMATNHISHINKTHTQSGVEKSLFQFSLHLLI